MQSYLEKTSPETAGHRLRTQELASRLAARLSLPLLTVMESCREFDEAAELGALEGNTIRQSMRQFLAERSGPVYAALGQLAGCDFGPVDFDPARLPVAPRAFSRLMRSTEDGVSAAEFEAIAGADPVLTARVLSAANSARFGSRSQITRLREAVMRIGIPEARRIMISACVTGLFASKTLYDLWKHSKAVASASAEIAGQIGVDPERAWAAGLLHDIGRAVQATSPAGKIQAEQNWRRAGFPLVYSETMAYGTDHAETGARLLGKWNLPEEITGAVAHHHRPEASDGRLPAVLCLAEDLVAARLTEETEDLWPTLRCAVACQRAGIDPEHFQALQDDERISECA